MGPKSETLKSDGLHYYDNELEECAGAQRQLYMKMGSRVFCVATDHAHLVSGKSQLSVNASIIYLWKRGTVWHSRECTSPTT